MKKTYLVSVLTPIHNTPEPLVKRAFQSLLCQSFGFENLEWVVLLHNCDEAYKESMRNLLAAYPNVLLTEADAAGTGVGYARNQTLRLATGKWIFFLDADDEMRPYCIERVVQKMEESHADTAVMEALWHLDDKDLLYWSDGLPEEENLFEAGDLRIGKSLCMSGLTLWTRCYRRAFLIEKGIRFDETLRCGEDFPFNLAATAGAKRVVSLPGFCGYDYYAGIGMTNGLYHWKEDLSEQEIAENAQWAANSFVDIYQTGEQKGLCVDNYLWFGLWLCLRLWLFTPLPDRYKNAYFNAYFPCIEPVLCRLHRPEMINPERQFTADYIYRRLMEEYCRYRLRCNHPFPELSLDDCTFVAKGTCGVVYALDEDRIVKIYPGTDDNAGDMVAKLWTRGVWLRQNRFPMAEVQTVVKTAKGYGLITERVVGTRIPQAVYRNPEQLERYGRQIGRLLKRVHAYRDDSGLFPDVHRGYYDMVSALERVHILERWESSRIKALYNTIPRQNTLVHQDISMNNLIVRNDELILIDQDTLSSGHPMFDLIPLYRNLVSLAELREPEKMTVEQYRALFQFILQEYFQTEESSFLEESARVLRGYGLLWLICGAMFIQSPDLPHNEHDRREMALAYKQELFSVIDTLHPISPGTSASEVS